VGSERVTPECPFSLGENFKNVGFGVFFRFDVFRFSGYLVIFIQYLNGSKSAWRLGPKPFDPFQYFTERRGEKRDLFSRLFLFLLAAFFTSHAFPTTSNKRRDHTAESDRSECSSRNLFSIHREIDNCKDHGDRDQEA
jgi:hypothetical protein